MPNIFNIPAAEDFLKELAAGVIERFDAFNKPKEFSEILILLPNKRSCRRLRECFVECAGDKGLFLPQIKSIGDFDDDEIELSNIDLQPVMPKHRKKLIFAKLIMAWQKENWQDDKSLSFHYSFDQALSFAGEIIAILDDMEKHQIPISELKSIVPLELASHWQVTLDLLNAVLGKWPEILKAEGRKDSVEWRHILIDALIEQIKNSDSPVIIAGSSGSQPATANLIKTVAEHKYGYVIISGLDIDCDEEFWNALQDNNSQFQLKKLLGVLGALRSQVNGWQHYKPGAKDKFISEVLRPSSVLSEWHNLKIKVPDYINMVEAADIQQEAEIIALKIREYFEGSKGEVAVISNSRTLTKRTKQILEKWGIEANDSSGALLSETLNFDFFILCAELFNSEFRAINLAALIKHKLFYKKPKGWLVFEKKYLRGIRKYDSIPGLIKLLELDEAINPEIKEVFAQLNSFSKDLENILLRNESSLKDIVKTHMIFAEKMASGLWEGVGADLYNLLIRILDSLEGVDGIEPRFYLESIKSLMRGEKYWDYLVKPSRVQFLTPIEARLLHFDMVILGGMNDSLWPKRYSSPILNNMMRQDIGLNSFDLLVGLSAHDFYYFISKQKVFITRSAKEAGQITIPSSFIIRLKTLCESLKLELDRTLYWQFIASKFKASEGDKAELLPPVASPPLEARKKKISVTRLELLIRNPYQYYASEILKLRPLDDFDKEADAREFGTLIHRALELFSVNYKEGSRQEYIEAGKQAFSELSGGVAKDIWWARYEDMADYIIGFEKTRRAIKVDIVTEAKGLLQMEGVDIEARADRIEIKSSEFVDIIDFKTGTLPTKKEISNGFSPQLIVEGLMVQKSGFDLINSLITKHKLQNFIYIKLFSSDGIEIKGYEFDKFIAEYETYLGEVLQYFFKQGGSYISYPFSSLKTYSEEYEHLIRKHEWYNYSE